MPRSCPASDIANSISSMQFKTPRPCLYAIPPNASYLSGVSATQSIDYSMSNATRMPGIITEAARYSPRCTGHERFHTGGPVELTHAGGNPCCMAGAKPRMSARMSVPTGRPAARRRLGVPSPRAPRGGLRRPPGQTFKTGCIAGGRVSCLSISTCSSLAQVRAACAPRVSRRASARVSRWPRAATSGGTCVNVGCVPKKMLVYGAHYSEELEQAHAIRLVGRRAHFRLGDADRPQEYGNPAAQRGLPGPAHAQRRAGDRRPRAPCRSAHHRDQRRALHRRAHPDRDRQLADRARYTRQGIRDHLERSVLSREASPAAQP